jgi:hypothetical protein
MGIVIDKTRMEINRELIPCRQSELKRLPMTSNIGIKVLIGVEN